MSEGIYLAREILSPEPIFYIRQSYRDKETGLLHYRELFRLGVSPSDYLIYIDDCGYHIRPEPVEAITPFIQGDPEEILEDLFWPFVKRKIRRRLKHFTGRDKNIRSVPLTEEDLVQIKREIHVFDRRRLHYFWYGAIDQGRLYGMPLKLCRKLLGMSRDQKEQYFIAREEILPVDKIKEYIYTVFNLQQYFSEIIARIMPQGLNQEKMDDCFIRELCLLNKDRTFWHGMETPKDLSPYLVRYLINYFDHDFGGSSALEDYIRNFMDSRRQFRFPERRSRMNLTEASVIFSEPPEKLKKLTKSELTRLFRRKAKKLHPDTGGEHDEFLKLVEAYEKLLRTK